MPPHAYSPPGQLSRRRFVTNTATIGIGLQLAPIRCLASPLGAGPVVALGGAILRSVLSYAGESIALWALDRALSWFFPWSRKWRLDKTLEDLSTAISFLLLLCPECSSLVRLQRLTNLRWRTALRVAEAIVGCPTCDSRRELSFPATDLLDALREERSRSTVLLSTADELAAYWRARRHTIEKGPCQPTRGDVLFGWNSWTTDVSRESFLLEEPDLRGGGLLVPVRQTDLVFVYLGTVHNPTPTGYGSVFAQVASPQLPAASAYAPWVASDRDDGLGSWGIHGPGYQLFCYKNGRVFRPA